MAITLQLIGQFLASITPIYFTFLVGVVYCFTDVLVLDFVPAISALIQYVCLPALFFLRIAQTPSSELDLKLLGADALTKLVPFVLLLLWWRFFSKYGKVESMEWVVTMWMLATLPNTVLIGDQVLVPMFSVDTAIPSLNITADDAVMGSAVWTQSKTTNIIFAQSVYWYNCVILMMEIREMFVEDERKQAINDPETAGQLADGEGQQRSFEYLGMEKSRQSWEMGTPEMGTPVPARETWEQSRLAEEPERPNWEMGKAKWSKGPYDGELADFSNDSMTPTSMTPFRQILTPSRMFGTTPSRNFTPSRMMTPGSMIGTPSRIVTPSRLMTPSRNMTPSPMGTPIDEDSMQSTPMQFISEKKGLGPEFYPQKPGQAMTAASEPNIFSRSGRTFIRATKRMLQVPIFYGTTSGFIWSINGWAKPSPTRLPWLYYSVDFCASGTIGLAMMLLGMICVKYIKGARGWIPCGWKLLFAGFIVRFVFGPIVMYICALAVNLKQAALYYAIIQVMIPQGSMSFALAQMYGVKLEVIAPAVYIQMIVFVPIILACYEGLESFGTLKSFGAFYQVF